MLAKCFVMCYNYYVGMCLDGTHTLKLNIKMEVL